MPQLAQSAFSFLSPHSLFFVMNIGAKKKKSNFDANDFKAVKQKKSILDAELEAKNDENKIFDFRGLALIMSSSITSTTLF